MTCDELAPLVRAYREDFDVRRLDAQRVRRRILGELGQRRSRHAALAWWLVPASAMLFSSVALGATGHPWYRAVAAALDRWVAEPSYEAPVKTQSRRSTRPPSHVVAAPISAVLPNTVPYPSEATVPRVADERAATHAGAGPSARGASVRTDAKHPATADRQDVASAARASDIDRDLRLYQIAHGLHFGNAAPEQALAAWQDYLRAFPHGALEVEARYNLAVCLLKTGRLAEAESRLRGFASGLYGSYRREQARELLAAMHARQGNARGGHAEGVLVQEPDQSP